MTTRPTVLVLDGEQRAALAVVRSLGRQGCRVHVGSSDRHSLAGGSRYSLSEALLPEPLAGAEAFADAVAGLARERGASVLLPVTEASTLAVLQHRDRLPSVSIPAADFAHFRHASDKAAVLSIAGDLGIMVPNQWTVSGAPGSAATVSSNLFPVVVKPARSVAGKEGHRRKVGVHYAGTQNELERVLSELGLDAGPFLIQERLEGPGLGIFLLRWQGVIIASFAHRRIREKPPSGGVSVCCESISAPPGLMAQSVSLLDALNWQGVAMVEYKHDIRSGRDCLMEVNPRFWGSLQLAIDAGVDFPWLLTRLALGEKVPVVDSWRVGTRSRWYLGELDHLLTRLLHSHEELHLPSDDPGFFRTLASMLHLWRSDQHGDVFRAGDPMPAVREAVAWIRTL